VKLIFQVAAGVFTGMIMFSFAAMMFLTVMDSNSRIEALASQADASR